MTVGAFQLAPNDSPVAATTATSASPDIESQPNQPLQLTRPRVCSGGGRRQQRPARLSAGIRRRMAQDAEFLGGTDFRHHLHTGAEIGDQRNAHVGQLGDELVEPHDEIASVASGPTGEGATDPGEAPVTSASRRESPGRFWVRLMLSLLQRSRSTYYVRRSTFGRKNEASNSSPLQNSERRT